MNLDIQRLSPTERLRHHVRRCDIEEARALALRLIDEGSKYTVEDFVGKERPLIHSRVTDWLDMPTAELRWVVAGGSRVQALWDDQRARLFACACAENVLHIFEEEHPHDPRPRQAIEVARRYAMGSATGDELRFAHHVAFAALDPYNVSAAAYYAVSAVVSAAARYAARWAARSATRYADSGALRRDALEPLMLRHMLLPIDELTTTSQLTNVEVAR